MLDKKCIGHYHFIANDRLSNEEKSFLLENGTYSRYEPVGVTWNDSFCRRIVNEGQPGCFVERDINFHQMNNELENNCTGRSLKTSNNIYYLKWTLSFEHHIISSIWSIIIGRLKKHLTSSHF